MLLVFESIARQRLFSKFNLSGWIFKNRLQNKIVAGVPQRLLTLAGL
jgi:hypothetical protein